ncbi:MAG: Na/Pi cotransporter family protein [Bacteroidetes bacterium]|jgi:phosphate:Na+ symporter|nr:Na/Pi cotransporter family protein [Bacteroidota bacterium]
MNEIILSIIAGLILFLFSVINLSEILELAIGEKARIWIKRYTSHIFSSLLVGIIVTTLLGSSSAAIIITILFVNTQILSFRQALGIVMGANIGTTISSQIIALDIGKFSPLLLVLGFVLLLVSKSPSWKNSGKVILYFGILFFGLYTMEQAVTPLKEEEFFLAWMKKTETPIVGAAVGAIVTLIIQSSSATVGMAIVLAKKGLLSLMGGVAVMLGAELGTCSDTLLATIKGSRQALKTGLFHLIFNVITIILGLIFFYPFLDLVTFVSSSVSIQRAVANAHMLFNFLGVLLFVWAIPLFEWGLNKMLPDKPE